MFDNIELFQMAQSMARHAATRQGAISQNIAHADTPGYAARDTAPFAEIYERQSDTQMRATRPQHLASVAQGHSGLVRDMPSGGQSPNANTVSLEREMVRGVEAQKQHDMALSIYRSATDIWRTSLGR